MFSYSQLWHKTDRTQGFKWFLCLRHELIWSNHWCVKPLVFFLVFFLSACRSRPSPAEEPTAESTEEPTDVTPTSWMTSSPELQEPENMPGLGDEELPHMLLPDSLSQLEEFGRHKRLRKAHRGHGRPRLFSDLWVRFGDRWVSALRGIESPCFKLCTNLFLLAKLISAIFPVCLQKHFSATKLEDYQWLCNGGSATDTFGAAQTAGDPPHPEAPDPSLSHSACGQLGPHGCGSQHAPAGDSFSLDVVRLAVLLLTTQTHTGRKELQDDPLLKFVLLEEDSHLPNWLISQNEWNKLSAMLQATTGLCWSMRPPHLTKTLKNNKRPSRLLKSM